MLNRRYYTEFLNCGNRKLTLVSSGIMLLLSSRTFYVCRYGDLLFEREGSNIKGLARIYFEDRFIVNNVNILQGKENLFVAMPSYKTKQMDDNGKRYQEVCYPVTKEFIEKLYKEILSTYEWELHQREDKKRKQGTEHQQEQRQVTCDRSHSFC